MRVSPNPIGPLSLKKRGGELSLRDTPTGRTPGEEGSIDRMVLPQAKDSTDHKQTTELETVHR